MSPTERTSLSSTSTPANNKVASLSQYSSLDHPPEMAPLKAAPKGPCKVEHLSIKVQDGPDGSVPGFLHLPADFTPSTSNHPSKTTAAILLSGAGGGLVGPSSIYLTMASKLATLSNDIPVLRLDFRYPARNQYCCHDVLAAMDLLENNYKLSRFVLVGWSFGGAPVFTVGGADQRVVGCATVASQTAETEGVRKLAPRPVLLLHGMADRTLSPQCSERLYAMYGTKGDRQIAFFDKDDHALTRNSLKAEEMLCEFIMKCAGLKIEGGEQKGLVGKELIGGKQKIETMKKGGDLRGEESVE